ncbi:UNVERIFIED_CONTAM: hypothetical protein FKN15_016076 [Acipenser sinensis]
MELTSSFASHGGKVSSAHACRSALNLCSTLVYAVCCPGCVTARGPGQAIACAAPSVPSVLCHPWCPQCFDTSGPHSLGAHGALSALKSSGHQILGALGVLGASPLQSLDALGA